MAGQPGDGAGTRRYPTRVSGRGLLPPSLVASACPGVPPRRTRNAEEVVHVTAFPNVLWQMGKLRKGPCVCCPRSHPSKKLTGLLSGHSYFLVSTSTPSENTNLKPGLVKLRWVENRLFFFFFCRFPVENLMLHLKKCHEVYFFGMYAG